MHESDPASAFCPAFRIGSDEFAQNYDSIVSALLQSHPVIESDEGYYLLSRYADVRECALDPAFSASRGIIKPRPDGMATQYPMEADPPLHTALRSPLGRFFTVNALRRLEPLIRTISYELIDQFGPDGCEAIAAFCRPLPGLVIFRGLLDLPAEMVEPLGKAVYQMFKNKPGGSERFQAGVDDVLAYHSAKTAPTGLMAAILALEIDGKPAEYAVKRSIVSLLIVGGLETTTGALSQAIHYLGAHPGDRDALVHGRTTMSAAVEEFLRLLAPAWLLGRVVTEERTVAGQTFRDGDFVYLGWGPASRDPAKFADPLRWVPGREEKGHLAFGLGRHRCLGAALATLELEVALDCLLERHPALRVEPGFMPRYSVGVNRTIARLPIAF
jgi:cytochrome P450